VLQVGGLSCAYGPIVAVDQLDLEVPDGSLVCVLGANGAGKSTTLKAIAGTVQASRGRISFNGDDITRYDAAKRLGRGVALCPEGRRVFGEFTVRQNLVIGGHVLGRSKLNRRLAEATELFPALGERMAQPAGSLSGGEQQMLAIARALMTNPKLLLLDEPSLGLAPRLTQQLFQTITEIREQGTATLLVEQNSSALKICDYAYVLANGRVAHEGPAADLMGDDRLRQAYLGG
jgi:branched-chain amino acid transport system ATP-binding protein